jgi:hypothetical protein
LPLMTCLACKRSPQRIIPAGTGTALGDPIEAAALHAALVERSPHRQRPVMIGAIKACVGHLEGAAGMAGMLKTALALKLASTFTNGHLSALNPQVAPFLRAYGLALPVQSTPLRRASPPDSAAEPSAVAGTPLRRASPPDSAAEPSAVAGVSSFGFGGSNAHALLQAAAPMPPTLSIRSPRTPAAPAECAPLREMLGTHIGAAAYRAQVYPWRWRPTTPRASAAESASAAAGAGAALASSAPEIGRRVDHHSEGVLEANGSGRGNAERRVERHSRASVLSLVKQAVNTVLPLAEGTSEAAMEALQWAPLVERGLDSLSSVELRDQILDGLFPHDAPRRARVQMYLQPDELLNLSVQRLVEEAMSHLEALGTALVPEIKSEIGLSSTSSFDETETVDLTGSADSHSLSSSDSVNVNGWLTVVESDLPPPVNVKSDLPPPAHRGWIAMEGSQHANGEGNQRSVARRDGLVMETSALQRAMIFEHLRSPEQVRVHAC